MEREEKLKSRETTVKLIEREIAQMKENAVGDAKRELDLIRIGIEKREQAVAESEEQIRFDRRKIWDEQNRMSKKVMVSI